MTAMEEKYVRAVRSSSLLLKEAPGDADSLIAAGLINSGMGLGLDIIRLRADYDTISGMPGSRRAMSLLKRMQPTRLRLINFALELASRRKVALTNDKVEETAVRVLDLMIDPACWPCSGTGLVGEFGSVRNTCSSCHGTKLRRAMWESENQKLFAEDLQSFLVDKVESSLRRMQRMLRSV
jgi:hypothetical protein